MCSSMNEFYEIANFMNTWSQQQEEELHESFVNRLYECKPVKNGGVPTSKLSSEVDNSHWLKRSAG